MANSLKELMDMLGPEITKEVDEMYEKEKPLFLLKMIRQELKLSQADIAKKLKISQPAVSAIENRGDNVSMLSFIRYIQSINGSLDMKIRLSNGKTINHTF